MSSLITSLYTGASGIYVNQTAVQVTGNNIANLSTTGYSRQTVNITSATQLEQAGLSLGTGSTVDHIDRAGDTFVTKQLIAQSAVYGEYEAASTPLSDVEQILSIGDSSLSSDIDSFFDTWEQLSANPGGVTEREGVLGAAENLANHFQQIDQQLTTVIDSIDSMIGSAIPSLNENLTQIAKLNNSIMQTEVSGGDANTLKDQRDLLVQEVSEITGASAYIDDKGMICLQLKNGLPLVTGNVASTLITTQVNGQTQVSLVNGQTSFSLDVNDLGGSLHGLLTVRDENIPEIRDDINRLAYEIATAVNTLHVSGVDQNGNSGQVIFNLTAPVDPTAPVWDGAAASISLNFNDTSMIAAGTSSLSGDNSLTLDMVAIRDAAAINGATYSEEYGRIVANVGLLVSSNEQKLSSSLELLNEISTKRDSISGVSSDEEMVLLIQYQAGYEAATHYLSVVQEMLDTLLQL